MQVPGFFVLFYEVSVRNFLVLLVEVLVIGSYRALVLKLLPRLVIRVIRIDIPRGVLQVVHELQIPEINQVPLEVAVHRVVLHEKPLALELLGWGCFVLGVCRVNGACVVSGVIGVGGVYGVDGVCGVDCVLVILLQHVIKFLVKHS